MNTRCDCIVVFADDWGRHPSSAQHIFARLLSSHTVIWVNTIGTRAPKFDWYTIRRAWHKLFKRSTVDDADSIPAALTVLNPMMWPWFSSRLDKSINAWLLKRAIRKATRHCIENNIVAVTTIPLVADIVGMCGVSKWIYYCVDDFSEWPGLEHQALAEMERILVAKCDAVVCASQKLVEQVNSQGREADLLTHGVDLKFWRKPTVSHHIWKRIPSGPRFVFWGVIDPRLDISFVDALSGALDQGSIVLVGPQQDADPELFRLPNVCYLGPLPFRQLPALGQSADVLIMPYADIPVTRLMQPLKLLEYLATYKPVVARRLPAVEPWDDCLDAIDDANAFALTSIERSRTGITAAQTKARKRLEEESWDSKASIFEAILK